MTESHFGLKAVSLGQSSDQIGDDERAGEDSREGQMPCPVCGHSMPDLKGGKATICPSCGFKDSCCY